MNSFILQQLEDIEGKLITAAGSGLPALTEFLGKYSELQRVIGREMKNGFLDADTMARVLTGISSTRILAKNLLDMQATLCSHTAQLHDATEDILTQVCSSR